MTSTEVSTEEEECQQYLDDFRNMRSSVIHFNAKLNDLTPACLERSPILPAKVYQDILLWEQDLPGVTFDNNWLVEYLNHVEDFLEVKAREVAEERFRRLVRDPYDYYQFTNAAFDLRRAASYAHWRTNVPYNVCEHSAYTILRDTIVAVQENLGCDFSGPFEALWYKVIKAFVERSDFYFFVSAVKFLTDEGEISGTFDDVANLEDTTSLFAALSFIAAFCPIEHRYPQRSFNVLHGFYSLFISLRADFDDYTENWAYCEGCDNYFERNRMDCLPNGELACESCYETALYELEREELGEWGELEVECYSYRPSPIFHYVDGPNVTCTYYPADVFADRKNYPVFMGVELETNADVDWQNRVGGGTEIMASPVCRDYDFIYAKSDCTVSGPEIVSHPATLSAHKVLWDSFPFETLTNNFGWRAWNGNRAGIHVHISRRSFVSDSHLARFGIYFGYWSEHIKIFAGRDSSYASFQGAKCGNNVKYAKGEATPARYSALNYENRNTVEVRVFRSSLRYDTIIAYLEFLEGLVAYSREKNSHSMMKESAVSWRNFVDYLAKNNYKKAVERITERAC